MFCFSFFFLPRHVGVDALCICRGKVIEPCCYLCDLFFSSCVHVCAHGGFTPGGRAPARFLSLSCAAQSGEALSPAICLPALGIVIPKYRPVNISLVTATSPQQHSVGGGREDEEERRCSLCTLPFSFIPPSLHPPEPTYVTSPL